MLTVTAGAPKDGDAKNSNSLLRSSTRKALIFLISDTLKLPCKLISAAPMPMVAVVVAVDNSFSTKGAT
ncbi:hypothetical protein D3C73_1636810 [compost metagenome]